MSISMSYRRRHENVGTLVAAKHPLKERTGWLFQATDLIGGFKQPPRLRRQRNGPFFSMAQPPLLREGGVYAHTILFVVSLFR